MKWAVDLQVGAGNPLAITTAVQVAQSSSLVAHLEDGLYNILPH